MYVLRSLLEHAARWWHRVLASPGFQRASAGSVFTRWLARRRTRAVFDLCVGFAYSQVLHAAVRLELFERLAERGPRTPESLALELGLSVDATRRLLQACTALQMCAARGGGRYDLGRHGAAVLGDGGVKLMILHQAHLYRDLSDPVAFLRNEDRPYEVQRYWDYEATSKQHQDGPEAERYSRLMAESVRPLVQDFLEAFPPPKDGRWLDVAGGEGILAEKLAGCRPGLTVGLVELPAVAKRARRRLERLGVHGVHVFEADARHGPLPWQGDGPIAVVSLVRVLHDHDDPEALQLLQRIRDLAPQRLVVVEPMRGFTETRRLTDVYFNLYLWAMGQGRCRSTADLDGLLREAGFVFRRRIRLRRPHFAQVLVAEPETP